MICVRRHTTNKVVALVTDAPAKRAPSICPLWKSDTSLVYEVLQQHNVQSNDTGTTQHKQTKERRKVQLMFIEHRQQSFISILYSVYTILSIPCISKMYHLTIWKSHRIKSILKKSVDIPHISLNEPTSKSLHQCFRNVFVSEPLSTSKNKHGSPHHCSCKYSVSG